MTDDIKELSAIVDDHLKNSHYYLDDDVADLKKSVKDLQKIADTFNDLDERLDELETKIESVDMDLREDISTDYESADATLEKQIEDVSKTVLLCVEKLSYLEKWAGKIDTQLTYYENYTTFLESKLKEMKA